jgi:hypothetical protein
MTIEPSLCVSIADEHAPYAGPSGVHEVSGRSKAEFGPSHVQRPPL